MLWIFSLEMAQEPVWSATYMALPKQLGLPSFRFEVFEV